MLMEITLFYKGKERDSHEVTNRVQRDISFFIINTN